MPASYRIDTELGIVFSFGTGTVTDEDLLNHQESVGRDPLFHPGMSQLLDGRGVTDVKVTPQGVRSLISVNLYGKGSKRALVAPNDIIFGMARMYELSRIDAEDEFRVFRSIDQAREWLGLPPEDAPDKHTPPAA